MAEQGRDDCVQEQDWLSFGIQVIINNSPGTGGLKVRIRFFAPYGDLIRSYTGLFVLTNLIKLINMVI
jgi:hypothetical protein